MKHTGIRARGPPGRRPAGKVFEGQCQLQTLLSQTLFQQGTHDEDSDDQQ